MLDTVMYLLAPLFKALAENAKKGVLQAGGMPVEIPALSLSENFVKPTTMLYRWAELRAGRITQAQWEEVEEGIARSHGHCMTMGTASTMAAIAKTLGLTLPHASSIH